MARHNEIGKLGEAFAKTFLIDAKYQILETNWRFKRAEIDIIAKHEKTLVFVEVKTRSTVAFGEPATFVTQKKELLMFDAANAYMEKVNHEWEIRFDIISVLLDQHQSPTIQHDQDAFFF